MFFINAFENENLYTMFISYILIIVEYFSNELVVSVYIVAVAAIVLNSSSISEGYCNQDVVNLTLIPDCDFKCIDVSIQSNEANFILQCNISGEEYYVDKSTSLEYVLTNQTLDISFLFNHQQYAGKCIIFSTHCQNQTLIPDHVLLKPWRK